MNTYEYDAFLSFAIEDKIEVANALHSKLEERGLKVWYSGRELKLGTKIEDKIREGLDKSEFGILIITPNYFQARWAIRELGALWAKERGDKKVIIPVFHNITPEQVGEQEPSLSERWGVRTDRGLDLAVEQIVNHIRGGTRETSQSTATGSKKSSGIKKLVTMALALIVLALLSAAVWYYNGSDLSDQLLTETIEKRIASFEDRVEQERADMINLGASGANQQEVVSFLDRFQSIEAQYRNYYFFSNGYQEWEYEKNVSPASNVDFGKWKASDDYGFKHPVISELSQSSGNRTDVTFIYLNTQPVDYKILSEKQEANQMVVSVAYTQRIRLANFRYEYGPQTSYRRHTTYSLLGFKSKEKYVFEEVGDHWEFVAIQ